MGDEVTRDLGVLERHCPGLTWERHGRGWSGVRGGMWVRVVPDGYNYEVIVLRIRPNDGGASILAKRDPASIEECARRVAAWFDAVSDERLTIKAIAQAARQEGGA